MKLQAANTQYEENDAEYDASLWNYQICGEDADDPVVLCTNEELRDRIMELMKDDEQCAKIMEDM